MTTTLDDTKLKDLLPDNLKDDIESICFSAAFDEIVKNIFAKTRYIQIFSRVDSLNSEELTLLARELHVDVYDENWTLTKKRAACKNSINWHINKGTTKILSDIAQSLIGSSIVREWFEYGGLSYHFKIFFNIENDSFDIAKIQELYKITEKYKNLRSKLDGLDYLLASKDKAQFLALSTMGKTIFIEQLGE